MMTAHELIRTTPATYRQLDYWTRIGVIRPDQEAQGSGSLRGFGETETRIVRLVAGLRMAYGCPLKILGDVAGQARGWQEEAWHGHVFIGRDGTVHRVPQAGCWWVDLDELLSTERVA